MKSPELIIRRLKLTEKGAGLTERQNQYLFEVSRDANKIEIKSAVEKLFKVGVTKVNTMTRAGKPKRNRRGGVGFRPDRKRAIVTLKDGDKIDLT
ncbi:MAG: 50S ribosomal protein L23 [Kiritimatiellae bacterium]|nr:50S ribosomal protein L23 [Kiritimatiellia bacterium]MCO5044632.1 50S ribosomal protein L23 [Kiritimatiellia bacterium]MCO5060939.1 50S ribosomal protein L23 [Kiritimatiellia bacterium]MCO5068146.1 50S ribosomal protein L23 [Kiritimatiellia bacterium]MCO6400834.1 50S ribosomal protein L23 [Verrucomicrobiota bacterium]